MAKLKTVKAQLKAKLYKTQSIQKPFFCVTYFLVDLFLKSSLKKAIDQPALPSHPSQKNKKSFTARIRKVNLNRKIQTIRYTATKPRTRPGDLARRSLFLSQDKLLNSKA